MNCKMISWLKNKLKFGGDVTADNITIVHNQEEIEQDFLKRVTYDDVDYFHLKGLNKWAKAVSVYDGDTVTLVFFVNGRPQKWRCRLANLDTAEKRSEDPAERIHAQRATDRLMELIGPSMTVWVKFLRMDKYFRPLVELYANPEESVSLNDLLLAEGLAYEYYGGKRIPFRQWALKQFWEEYNTSSSTSSDGAEVVDNIQDDEVIEADDAAEYNVHANDYQPETNIEKVSEN